MANDDFWRTVQDKDIDMPQRQSTGVLNLSLLFGTAVIALTLILTPMLSQKSDSKVLANAPIDYDTIQTARSPRKRARPSATRFAAAFCRTCRVPSA